MRFVSSLPVLGRPPPAYASILPLTVSRSASRLSGIHHGIRRTERASPPGFSPKKEIRQKREDEPYLSPEERRRQRAIARRDPVEYKIRKGKKDITEDPGPPRKSRAARFNDPRDPYGSHSNIKKLKTGELLDKVRNKMKNPDMPMSPKDFELQLKLEEAEGLLGVRSRRQHEKSTKFAERMEKRAPSWKAKDEPLDPFENAPKNRFQSRDGGRDERRPPTLHEATEDRPERYGRRPQYDDGFLDKGRDEPRRASSFGSRNPPERFGRVSRYDSGGFNESRDEPRGASSSGSREDRFDSSRRSQRYQNEPETGARSYGFKGNASDRDGRYTNRREKSDDNKPEPDEANDESGDGFNLVKTKKWEPPVVVPYTTAASQFLYGSSTVEAAIEANRRQMYKLYIYTGSNRRNREKDDALAKMAERRGIKVEHMDEAGLAIMNKMSGSRAHNGFILEASPLPQTPVKALGEVPTDGSRPGFNIALGYQSREEAFINGTPDFIITEPSSHKPFVLLLDQILDPGNLGAVMRTASFMGVTAVVLSKRGSAPVTPTVLKASAGAAETLTMMTTESVVDFVTGSQANGWKVYAAVPPKLDGTRKQADIYGVESKDPLLEHPCILVMGNEGEGLSRQLQKAADVQVGIPNMGGSKVVDSLNVSVAAGLLCQAFLRGKTTASMVYGSGLESASREADSLF